jgi:hypothetical protein
MGLMADYTTNPYADAKTCNMLAMDLDLYPGSTDLGPVSPDSHFYAGNIHGNQDPIAQTGYLDFSSNGLGSISLPAGTTFPRVTVMAVVKKMVARTGSTYHSYFSDLKNYQNFTTLMEAIGGTPNPGLGDLGGVAATAGDGLTSNDSMELVTSTPLSFTPTWQLVKANSLPAGQRRRFIDLAGVCNLGTLAVLVSPAVGDTINGSSNSVTLSDRYAFATLETDGKTNWTIVDYGKAMMRQDNLVDIPSPGSARSNLGLGSLATHPSTDFLAVANNLGDLTDKAAARANLGLAASSAITFSSFDPGAIATPADVTGNFYTGELLSTDVYWASRIPATLPFTITSGTTVAGWDFSTFINAIWNIPSTAPSSITLSPAINVKPGQRGFIIITCATSTARTLFLVVPL